jgi:2,3-bisphosphoglycerate-dependent phosphoglycerate mutase
MKRMVLLRHGQSEWNLSNRFTGWHDAALTEAGRRESVEAGRRLAAAGWGSPEAAFDCAFTSLQKRAIVTLWLALEAMDQVWIPIERSWRLNERHYGALTGLDKGETAAKYGEEQVKLWRRSYALRPPAFEPGDPRNPALDARYRHEGPAEPPLAESLADVVARLVPFWEERLAPRLARSRSILVAAHGNSLRALVKHLDGMSEADVLELNIPTGVPLVYDFDDDLRPLWRRYLASEEELERLQSAVAAQGRAKSAGA